MGGALALSMTPRSESSLLERYPTKDQDPLFLPELPKDPHPTNRESGDHSAVGHCQEAVTYCRVQSGRITGVPLEGQYLHIFHRAVPEEAKKTRPKELACPVIRPPYYQGGRPNLSSVDKWSPKPIGFVAADETPEVEVTPGRQRSVYVGKGRKRGYNRADI